MNQSDQHGSQAPAPAANKERIRPAHEIGKPPGYHHEQPRQPDEQRRRDTGNSQSGARKEEPAIDQGNSQRGSAGNRS